MQSTLRGKCFLGNNIIQRKNLNQVNGVKYIAFSSKDILNRVMRVGGEYGKQ